VLYAPDEWGKYAARLTRAKPKDKHVALFETFFIGGGADLPIDRQGCVRLRRACGNS
jgi:DNA-binding transcriptional regulator/RsmH inhibitor MraZ